MMMHNIMLVEGNRLMLEQLSNIINNTENVKLVARYQDANEALGQGIVFTPSVILLDADHQDSIRVLEEFSRVFPNAAIICTGEKWHAESSSLYVNAGAKCFLVKPFSSDDLTEAIASFSNSTFNTTSKVITFFSPKGKSGKTTLIANLAMAIARRSNSTVGIIDADLQFGDMALFFNLTPKSTIVEAARDTDFLSPVSLNSYYVPLVKNVSVLCGTKEPSLIDRVSIPALESLINMSKNLFQYLLIDVPAGFNPTSIAAAEMSDITYIVSMLNGGYELQHIQRALEIFKCWPDYQKRVKTLLTRVEPCTITAQKQLADAIGYPVEGIIPNAFLEISDAVDDGHMALDLNPNSILSQRINFLAKKIIMNKQDDEDDF
ncbi:MAG: P-loop NTPase [Anaerovibrio sp.]|uniref:P-loop NTPase n=1 Tax=Anaerovibrio sp. TaxID=1872532 RepID=UPI0025D12CAE|nr:P-loop NTPase [Anaerovibrio sp.]MCR5177120.1 P-loop NTPase [Anaerovibrio sp.]